MQDSRERYSLNRSINGNYLWQSCMSTHHRSSLTTFPISITLALQCIPTLGGDFTSFSDGMGAKVARNSALEGKATISIRRTRSVFLPTISFVHCSFFMGNWNHFSNLFWLWMWKRLTASILVGGITTSIWTAKWKRKRKRWKRHKNRSLPHP